MMLAALALAVVSIAFPKEGMRCPPIARCYVIGATDGGETNIVLRTTAGNRVAVPVYRTGAWGTLVDVVPGTNVIEAAGFRRIFHVAGPHPSAAKKDARTKTYAKLPYAGDRAKNQPAGRSPSEITIALDPGHGGSEDGAVSPHGWFEKEANLRLAQAVARALRKRGFRVLMTRTNDTTVALYSRPKVAHRGRADAFVSLHHNAPAYDKDPSSLRFQAVYAWNPLGERLARAINRRLAASNVELPNRGVIHANFAVTRNPEIPSCLVEADFITSPAGEESAWNPESVSRQGEAIADGIADWAAVVSEATSH